MSKLVVKIGGSFLTKKAQSDTFPTSIEDIQSQRHRFIEMNQLISISKEIRTASERHRIMLVHGAGPFGHALVERIQSSTAMDPVDVHRSMLILNSDVRLELSNMGFRCETTSPFNTVEFDGEFHTDELVYAMKGHEEEGSLPISHGDIVPTSSCSGRMGNYEVISGDVITCDLALGWSADMIIMITDLDGILDRDPKVGPGRRIPKIGYSECLDLLKGRSRKGADVTGGIGQKIVYCKKSIYSGIPLQIISGNRKGDLLAACEGGDAGTIVELR